MQMISVTVSITSHSFVTLIIQEVRVADFMIRDLQNVSLHLHLPFVGSAQDCMLSPSFLSCLFQL